MDEADRALTIRKKIDFFIFTLNYYIIIRISVIFFWCENFRMDLSSVYSLAVVSEQLVIHVINNSEEK